VQKSLVLLSLVIASLPSAVVATDYYKLPSIKRVDQDLYKSGRILVETRYCYHYTYGETAILKYEGSGEFSGSEVIWEDDSTCEVKKVVSQ
jgi:hypothetical protein